MNTSNSTETYIPAHNPSDTTIQATHWYDTTNGRTDVATYVGTGISIIGFIITLFTIISVKRLISNIKYKKKISTIENNLREIMYIPPNRGITAIQITESRKENVIGQINELLKIANKKEKARLNTDIESISSATTFSQVDTCVKNIITDFSGVQAK